MFINRVKLLILCLLYIKPDIKLTHLNLDEPLPVAKIGLNFFLRNLSLVCPT